MKVIASVAHAALVKKREIASAALLAEVIIIFIKLFEPYA